MIITLVMDQFGRTTNGTTATARRLAEKLKERGHTVRIVTCSKSDEDNVYVVKKRNFPILNYFCEANGMELAIPDKKVLREAFEGSDLVHFYMPFRLSRVGKKIADEMGIASTAAFHVQPENITYNIGMEKLSVLNHILYYSFRKFFNKFEYVHCPSEMIENELYAHKYKCKCKVVSNGVIDTFVKTPAEKPEELKDKFCIMMTARLSREKRQDLLIKAIGKSKYNDKIQLILCGRGPWYKKLRKLSDKYLKNPAIFKFCTQPELIKTINYCDLYVHSSDADIEAIGCMEAFSCGLVPVISDNKLVATKQFALCEKNLFKSGSYESLKSKIEYFIENPDEKEELSEKYVEYSEQYKINRCIDAMEEMFELEIKANKKRQAYLRQLLEYDPEKELLAETESEIEDESVKRTV